MEIVDAGCDTFTGESELAKTQEIKRSESMEEESTTTDIEEDRPIFISKYFLTELINAYMDKHAYEMLQRSLLEKNKKRKFSK